MNKKNVKKTFKYRSVRTRTKNQYENVEYTQTLQTKGLYRKEKQIKLESE